MVDKARAIIEPGSTSVVVPGVPAGTTLTVTAYAEDVFGQTSDPTSDTIDTPAEQVTLTDPLVGVEILTTNTDPSAGAVGARPFLFSEWKRLIRNGDFHDPPPNPGSPIDDTTNPLPGWSKSGAGTATWATSPVSSASGGYIAVTGGDVVLTQTDIPIRTTTTRNNGLLLVTSSMTSNFAGTSFDQSVSQYDSDDVLIGSYLSDSSLSWSASVTPQDFVTKAAASLSAAAASVSLTITLHPFGFTIYLFEHQLVELGAAIGGADVGDPANAPWTGIYSNGVLTIDADTLAISGTHAFVATDTIWDAANDYVRGSGSNTGVRQAASAATPAAVSTTGSTGTASNPPSADNHVHPHEAAHLAHDTLWDAKGDLVSGSGADTAVKTSVGADDTILMADAAASGGIKWVASATPAAVGTANSAGTSDDFSRGSHVHAHETGHVVHDTIWDAVGDLAVGTGADTAAKLAVSVPAANVRNVLGTDNGDTTPAWKTALDSTNPAALGAAAPGTSLVFAHRDHVHPTTGLSLNTHGIADHDDRTSSVWVGAKEMTADSGTAGTLGSVPNRVDVITLADGSTQGVYFLVKVPRDYSSGNFTLKPYWVPGSTDGTPHTVRWSMVVKQITSGTDVTAAGTTTAYTGASGARTANNLVTGEANTDTTISAAVGTMLMVNLRRVGADGNDTYVGAVHLVAVELQYTAAQ